MGGFVRLEGGPIEVEVAAGTVADRSQRAAPYAVANLIRGAIEIGRGRPGIQETALDGWRHGHDGRPLRIEPLLAGDAEQMELGARQFADKFGELVEGKECGDGSESTSTHG